MTPGKQVISVRGARQHNLKNVDVDIPRDQLVVITGLSGSGKSSLAFDTIYAEGQRRYVESLSSYARQFLGQMDKPDVDFIDGLSPAISIDQKASSRNPRSTVGTVTEIYDYLRLLFARVGDPHCPTCQRPITPQTPQEIVDHILTMPLDAKVLILAPVVRARKGNYTQLLQDLTKEGFSRVRVDGKIHHLSDDIKIDRYAIHDIEIVVDRLSLNAEQQQRLTESVETALKYGEGLLYVHLVDEGRDVVFSEQFACPSCNLSFGEITPKLFSFNSPYGACETCKGLGSLQEIDPELVFDRSRSLSQGGFLPWKGSAGSYLQSLIEAAGEVIGIDPQTPLDNVPEESFQRLCYGLDEPVRVKFTYLNAAGQRRRGLHQFEGVIAYLNQRFLETSSDYIRGVLEQYMADKPCPACQGTRLKPLPLAVRVGGLNIDEMTRSTIGELLAFVNTLQLPPMKMQIAAQVMKEIRDRIAFLNDVGLDYITLHRNATTLSGGEAQRIRLATQIGSNLTGVLYILDEPTIGLHQRDNERLIRTLKNLRDLGNTVIVVEHDEDTILAADHLIDLGPAAGEHGGQIVGAGTPTELMGIPESPTGRFLNLKYGKGIRDLYRQTYRKPQGWITIRGAAHNNLAQVTAKFPLKVLCAVTGVSGSGKSSLVNETLYRSVAHHFGLRTDRPGVHKKLEGLEQLDGVIVVDQSPIGRTPRSNPATYTKVFDKIRDLFTNTREAKVRGYAPGRFSFNVKGGRCETCEGDGVLRIEMHFLPDVYVVCESCQGKRYNRETLEVKYRGKSIAEVLALTVDEAVDFFSTIPAIAKKLQVISDVGLGYIRLGQPATTLSGGEAQRVKLAFELSKVKTGDILYVLDEPTTGLHYFDVQKLLGVMDRLVDRGNSVVVIEHNLDVIANADHVIDLGPEGGAGGGQIIATGTPRQVAEVDGSYTGHYLKLIFNNEALFTGDLVPEPGEMSAATNGVAKVARNTVLKNAAAKTGASKQSGAKSQATATKAPAKARRKPAGKAAPKKS